MGSVYTAEDIFESSQVKACKALLDIDAPMVGTYRFARGPAMLSSCPEPERKSAPDLGQHTREILENILQLDDAIDRLESAGVIQTS